MSSDCVFGETILSIFPIFSFLCCAFASFSIYSTISDVFRLYDFLELGDLSSIDVLLDTKS